MIKLIFPNPAKLKEVGIIPVSVVALRWTTDHPASHYGLGVLLRKYGSEIVDGATFRAARDNFGAVIVTDMSRGKICGALGVPQDEPGIVDGVITPMRYAEDHDLSRQYVHEMIQTGKLPAQKIGENWFIKNNLTYPEKNV